MPSPKSNMRKVNHVEKNRKGRLSEKASSFHGRGDIVSSEMLPRPRTVPDLLAWRRDDGAATKTDGLITRPFSTTKLSKLLLNVTIQRSVGAVHVLMAPEDTVEDLIAATLRQYVKEGRRPVLDSSEASGFDLHYSQFSLESLDRKEQLIELGSRNFFLFPKKATTAESKTAESGGASTTASCSKEAEKVAKKALPWLKFMDFLL